MLTAVLLQLFSLIFFLITDCATHFKTDHDECEDEPCGKNSTCINTEGGHICECSEGFDREPGAPQEADCESKQMHTLKKWQNRIKVPQSKPYLAIVQTNKMCHMSRSHSCKSEQILACKLGMCICYFKAVRCRFIQCHVHCITWLQYKLFNYMYLP